jgi:SAM-dependent methyltransferase
MASFVSLMGPVEGCRILDLGGTPKIWDSVPVRLKITCLNLPGARVEHPSHHQILYVTGDACSMPEFQAGDFDIVFSNSVIEHVGDGDRRQLFCKEVLRLSRRYWIQTPSRYFPIEAHCGMPFWWFYPQNLRELFLRRWRDKLPAWTEMVEGTDVVEAGELRHLLPGCRLITERFLMVPKSLVAYST